ncbi:MAG: thioredoxin TrxA [Gammaproteobacteria bacterium]|nr:thioredoxin TrxA [Gammaproteobacteria bacterium]
MSEHIHATSDDNFEADVLKSETPVLVDFWAEWCGPCKALMPTLEEVAKEYQGRVKVVKVNVDDNDQTPAKYGVRGIPNLILFKDGDIAASKVGAMSKIELAKFLDDHI